MDAESALMLWARLCRETVDIGYPRQQPFYTPTGYRESHPEPTDEDLWKAERVAAVMRKLEEKHPLRGQVARLYYGAYPGARHQTKRERLNFIRREIGVDRRDVYRMIDATKHAIEAVLEFA